MSGWPYPLHLCGAPREPVEVATVTVGNPKMVPMTFIRPRRRDRD